VSVRRDVASADCSDKDDITCSAPDGANQERERAGERPQTMKDKRFTPISVAMADTHSLDPPRRWPLLSPMCRMLIGGIAAFCWAYGLGAQPVPARDLWEFPLGAVLEPAALAAEPGAGLWNPAVTTLRPGERIRLGVASLSTGAQQGVDGQLLSASYRRASGTTWGLSVARSSVAGLVRTDSDPQSIGDISYASLLVSATAARTLVPHVTAGVAMRWREGRADREVNSAIAADLGVIVHDLPWRNTRVALSSFLWRPGREVDDRPAFVAAIDARVVGDSALRELRLGMSQNNVNRGASERGPFISGRLDRLEARAAIVRTSAGAGTVTRIRSGLAVYYARYVVGVAREEGISGLGPVYQFTLSSILKE